jgi:hypothetical protein
VIATEAWEGEGMTFSRPVEEVPMPISWKLFLQWAIKELAVAMAAAGDLATIESNWDAEQRVLEATLTIRYSRGDAAVKAAVMRLRGKLLLGDGTGQTSLPHQQEVDFGRGQLQKVSKSPLKEDAEFLGLGPELAAVGVATEALAAALGRDTPEGRVDAPGTQVRDAKTNCINVFNSVHASLDVCLNYTAPGAERDRLQALLAPLEGGLERARPGSTPKPPGEEPPPGEPPA